MTWKEIKDKIESLGVKDEDQVEFLGTYDCIFSLEDLELNVKLQKDNIWGIICL